jgi:hypothetical protein
MKDIILFDKYRGVMFKLGPGENEIFFKDLTARDQDWTLGEAYFPAGWVRDTNNENWVYTTKTSKIMPVFHENAGKWIEKNYEENTIRTLDLLDMLSMPDLPQPNQLILHDKGRNIQVKVEGSNQIYWRFPGEDDAAWKLSEECIPSFWQKDSTGDWMYRTHHSTIRQVHVKGEIRWIEVYDDQTKAKDHIFNVVASQ